MAYFGRSDEISLAKVFLYLNRALMLLGDEWLGEGYTVSSS